MRSPAERDEWGQRGLKCPPARGPNGQPLCRWCHTEVTPPKRAWCSQSCVDAYLDRQWPAIASRITKRDGACRECRKSYLEPNGYPAMAGDRVDWEVDHIVPVADGGTDHPDNLRLLCRPCHVRITTAWRRIARPTPTTEHDDG